MRSFGMRLSLAIVLALATRVQAGPWTLIFDPVALHRPLHAKDCPTEDCNTNSLIRFGLTRDVKSGLYIGAATGFMHLQAIIGARWISGDNTGVVVAAEVRPTVEIMMGAAVYGSLAAGWAFGLDDRHRRRLVVAPTIEAGPFWDRDHRRTIMVIGGSLNLAYGW